MIKENTKVQTLLQEARQLELEGKQDNAIKKYAKALDINPDCVDALEPLGLFYELKHEFEQAIVYRERVIELVPANNLAYAKLARVMLKHKQTKKGIALYQKAISVKSSRKLPGWVYKNLGDALHQTGEIDKAITVYQQAVKSQPSEPISYLGLGIVLLEQKKWRLALECFENVLNLNPSRKIIYEIANKIGNLAEDDLTELVNSNSDFDVREIGLATEIINLPKPITIPQGESANFAPETYENPQTKLFSLNNSSCKTQHLFFVSQHGAPPYNNYYHWMFQIIPQIYLWHHSLLNRGDLGKVVLPFYLQSSFQKETLNLLGISQFRILELADSNLNGNQNSLSFASPLSGNPRQWVCDLLKKEFITNKFKIPPGFERIYIQRNQKSYRQIINQEDLNRFLEINGFRSINLESLSILEQAALFNQSKVILSPHGAGLTNIVFCQPSTKVIEVFPKSSTPRMYRKISHCCDLEYYYLLSEDVNNNQTEASSLLQHCKDIIVNLDDLSELMKIARIS